MEYEVVYNAVESYQQLKNTIIIIALATLLPTIYLAISHWRKLVSSTKLYQDDENWFKTNEYKIMAVSIVALYVLIFIFLFGYTNSSIQKSQQRLETEKFIIVEGQMLEIQGKFGKNGRAFTVNNTRFEYHIGGAYNPRQFDNDCKDTGCLIQDHDDVRIYYYSDTQGANRILKVFRKP